jgi:hypothetical protein
VRAYLATSGIIFGIIAIAHVARAIDERQMLSTNPGQYFALAALGALSGVLSFWAWRLFAKQKAS